MKAVKGRAVGSEHSLIIHGRSAVPHPGIVRIIFSGIAGCPAGSICLPQLLICFYLCSIRFSFQPGSISHCDPCRLPVINAETSCFIYRSDNITNTVCLSLFAEFVGSYGIILSYPHSIVMSVRIGESICIARLRHHYVFSILCPNGLKLTLQIFQSSMPVRVIRCCKDIIIYIIILKARCPVYKLVCPLRIRKMDHNFNP